MRNKKHQQPSTRMLRMGFYCSLTEKDSSLVKPGMAAKYNKFINDLAAMAKLKKDLSISQNQKIENASRIDVDTVQWSICVVDENGF